MSEPHDIDGVLIQWGDRLFYPGNRIVKTKPQPKLNALAARQRAAAIRERIEATVVRRAPQVMVEPVPVEWTPRSATCAIFRRPAQSLATNRDWPSQG